MVGGDFARACLPSVGGGDCHSSFGAFGKLVPFELREGRDDGDHGLGRRPTQLAVPHPGDGNRRGVRLKYERIKRTPFEAAYDVSQQKW